MWWAEFGGRKNYFNIEESLEHDEVPWRERENKTFDFFFGNQPLPLNILNGSMYVKLIKNRKWLELDDKSTMDGEIYS